MKIVKILGFTFALLGAVSFAQAQSEIRKEVNVEVENGQHTVTIITTDEKGNTKKEVFTGEEAKEKMHELHSNVPKGAVIEREIVEEVTDEEGNEIVIKRKVTCDKDDMKRKFLHHPGHPMNEEEIREFRDKMEDLTSELEENEKKMFHHHMRMLHHDLTPEERKEFHEALMSEDFDIDVEVDEDAEKITIKIGDDVEVIDMKELKEMKAMHGMPHHRKMMRMHHCCDSPEKCDKKGPQEEVVVIMKSVRIEDDNSLQNDLKGIKFNTYPNPNNGEFFVDLKLDGKTPTTFIISDVDGKVVHEGEIDTEEKGMYTLPIKMKRFQKGVYLLQIVQGNKAATKKIIIE